MYQNDVQGKGYFRKSKAYGLVCGIALFGALAVGSTVSADEVTTTVETTPTVEAVNPNPATNLTIVQEAPSTESIVTEEKSGTSTGEIISPVTSSELNNAVSTAKDAGVTVTEETKSVIYDNLASAQQDLSKQASEVKVAEEKQNQNTTAIKDATATNEEIDRKNKEEAERIARENAEIDARNKAAQEKADKINSERKAQVIENEKARQKAMDYNKAEVERVEREYKEALAEWEKTKATTGVNDPDYIKAKAEYDQAKALYDIQLANYIKEKAKYEAELADMQAKTKEEGHLSEAVGQSLIYRSEPNVTIGSIDGVTKFVNPEKRKEVSNANRNLVHTVSSYSEGDYVGTVDYSNGTTFLLAVGQTATVTYVGDFSGTANGEKITKVVARYTVVSSEQGASIVTVSKDPTETVIFGSDATQGFVGVGDELRIEKTFYTVSGKVVATKENPIIFSISSMNSLGEDGYFEYVKDLSANMRFVPITGSQVQNHNGYIYASTSIDTIAPYSGHDSIDSPVRYYGSGAIVSESGDTFGLTVGASKHQTGHWFAMNTNVAASILEKKDIPEPEKPTPPEPKLDDTPKPEPGTPNTKEVPPLEKFIPVTVTPEPPKKPNFLPHIPVPEKETYEATVHPVIVKQTPANIKAVVNEDGVDVNGKLVPKGSVQTWVLTNTSLKAGRPVTTSYSMTDPLPAGFEVDVKATAEKNSAWVFSYDENGSVLLTATESTLKLLNANLNQDVGIPLAYFVGRTLNDGGTYKNTFVTNIGTPSGIYTTVSNIPVIYTPGNDPKTPRPPRVPNGENPTPNDNLIQPKKDVVDEKGNSINGQSVLPNSTLNYVATQDFDQYKGIVASQSAIAKGFVYVDDYLDKALDGQSMVVNSITAKNGDDVRELLDVYHVLSQDALDEKLQALIKESGISPVGEFYLWVAKDPEAFYKAYVQKGLDITYNFSFKIKKEFTEGQITNQTFQIDFGNGYYGNIVTNDLPFMEVHKEVLNKDGHSINNGTVSIGDEVVYKLEGWVVPAGRGYDVKEYRFVDLLQQSHDEFKAYSIEASVDITLSDGTVIKAGQDLSAYTETVYNADTGLFEVRFREDFLSQIPRSSEFGSDAYLTVTRIASGTVENEYTLYVNGNPVISNKVVTETPEPPKPEQKTPKQEVPALPNTGQASSLGLTVLGMVALFVSLFGLRKKNEE
ncbi:SspB-related isopeptide-forming adhesin [Streptococcus suis]|uniref:SspB-related isopeptide-forming adhesin n=1 Tax=Streptococcus suis TaxID=1307 RepID=UPI000C18B37E|nr:SspB-related isopeptide-forming adhesin [Streptococcus suis]